VIEKVFDIAIKAAELLKSKVFIKMVLFLCIVSGICLLFPQSWLSVFGLQQIIATYKNYFGGVFLITVSYIVVDVGWAVGLSFKKRFASRRHIVGVKNALNTLDTKEKSVLREFTFFQKQHAVLLPLLDPAVVGLLKKRILMQISQVGEQTPLGPVHTFEITAEAKPFVTEELLELAGELAEEELVRIIQQRPAFIAALQEREKRRQQYLTSGDRSVI
jgi:hypothetical protein